MGFFHSGMWFKVGQASTIWGLGVDRLRGLCFRLSGLRPKGFELRASVVGAGPKVKPSKVREFGVFLCLCWLCLLEVLETTI